MTDFEKGFLCGVIGGVIVYVWLAILMGCTHSHGPQVIPPIEYERQEKIFNESFNRIWLSSQTPTMDEVRSSTMTTSGQYPDYSMERDYDAWLKERQGR